MCRISDISLGGCFVQGLLTPSRGGRTEITIKLPTGDVTLSGQVVYVERAMGFAVEFVDNAPEALARLAELVNRLARHPPKL